MKNLVRIALFLVVALVLVNWLWPKPNRDLITGEAMAQRLVVYPWIHPQKEKLKSLLFVSLDGKGDFWTQNPQYPLSPELDQQAFEFISSEFIGSAQDFTSAQENFAKGLGRVPRPKLKGWGNLPYPPFEKIPGEISVPDETFKRMQLEQAQLKEFFESELTQNQELKIFENKNSLEPMIELIGRAKKFIVGQWLVVACDSSTESLISAIENKAHEGVEIRLLVNKGYSILTRNCLSRLEKAGVHIEKNITHSSYLLNDQKELIIGSQSWAWTFFEAKDFNLLDRDIMLYLRGPTATDALGDYLLQDPNANENLVQYYKRSRAQELEQSSRSKNREQAGQGQCRFLSQRPQDNYFGLQNMIMRLIDSSVKTVTFSGVKIDSDWDFVDLLEQKSNNKLEINYLGNGFEGGNGELTMSLTRWIDMAALNESWAIVSLLEFLKSWDQQLSFTKRIANYETIVQKSKINIWNHFHFLHYKVWSFDRAGFIISSANPNRESFEQGSEAGVFCLDKSSNQQLLKILEKDHRNSVKYE